MRKLHVKQQNIMLVFYFSKLFYNTVILPSVIKVMVFLFDWFSKQCLVYQPSFYPSVFLPLVPKSWEYNHVPLCLTSIIFILKQFKLKSCLLLLRDSITVHFTYWRITCEMGIRWRMEVEYQQVFFILCFLKKDRGGKYDLHLSLLLHLH